MASGFIIPSWVKAITATMAAYKASPDKVYAQLNPLLDRYNHPNPVVSIVIPFYNEEENIIPTLFSLAQQVTNYPTELILVDNNSTDNGPAIVEACGLNYLSETTQGISFARQKGLISAKGTIILSADADSYYPPTWLDTYATALLNDSSVSCFYGRYSFIPSNGRGRFFFNIYEIAAATLFKLRRKKYDYLNVMGFNCGFRRKDGLDVGGYNTNRPKWSDGWMAMSLAAKGTIKHLNTNKVRVWTSDRRLLSDGNLYGALVKRIKKEASRLEEYF